MQKALTTHKRHGAKVKLCSNEGYSNKKGGTQTIENDIYKKNKGEVCGGG